MVPLDLAKTPRPSHQLRLWAHQPGTGDCLGGVLHRGTKQEQPYSKTLYIVAFISYVQSQLDGLMARGYSTTGLMVTPLKGYRAVRVKRHQQPR